MGRPDRQRRRTTSLEPIDPIAPPGEDAGARYEGNPQLAVIESYALDLIGELSAEEVEETEQAVLGLLGGGSDWRRTVRDHYRWNALVDWDIAEKWCRFRNSARTSGHALDPAEFARRFADDVVGRSRS
jgi:hypothetical protein